MRAGSEPRHLSDSISMPFGDGRAPAMPNQLQHVASQSCWHVRSCATWATASHLHYQSSLWLQPSVLMQQLSFLIHGKQFVVVDAQQVFKRTFTEAELWLPGTLVTMGGRASMSGRVFVLQNRVV